MTRKEQIEKAAREESYNWADYDFEDKAQVFMDGAEWADQNPNPNVWFDELQWAELEKQKHALEIAMGALEFYSSAAFAPMAGIKESKYPIDCDAGYIAKEALAKLKEILG